MEIRQLEKTDIPQAKQLWKVCFGDSEEFISFFFENKFDRDCSLGVFEDGKLIADLMMIEKNVRIFGKTYSAGFLSGCATHPDHRYKGLMKTLLQKKLELMHEEGYALCFLHPFLHDFYRKFGWSTVSYVQNKKVLPAVKKGLPETDFDESFILNNYTEYTKTFPVYFLRDSSDMRIRVSEHITDGGFVFQGDGYYALYFIYDEYIDVTENTCRNDIDEKDMIYNLSGYGKRIEYFVPAAYGETADAGEYTMMRIVDICSIKDICERLGIAEVNVADDFCPWNSGAGCDDEAEKMDINDFSAMLANGLSRAGAVFFEQY